MKWRGLLERNLGVKKKKEKLLKIETENSQAKNFLLFSYLFKKSREKRKRVISGL